MSTDWSSMSDEALGQRLARDLPRYQAPLRVRAHIVHAMRPARRRTQWMGPALSALATAAVFVLFLIPALPRSTRNADAVDQIVNAVVAEHARAKMWGARRPDIIPAALPWLTQESGIRLPKAFLGDESLVFEGAEPVYLDWRRGVALHYRDQDGHRLTYVALPAPRMPVPERQRVQIEKFKPALMHVSGFATWVWKQGDIACFLVGDLVSDTDAARFKDYFVRVRTGTDPVPAY
jgi:hypothetical protein